MKIHKVKEYEPSINIRGKVTKDQLSRLDTVSTIRHPFIYTFQKKEEKIEDDKKDQVFAT